MLDNNEKKIMAHKARAKQMHNKRSTQEMSSIQSRFILFLVLCSNRVINTFLEKFGRDLDSKLLSKLYLQMNHVTCFSCHAVLNVEFCVFSL